MDLGIEGKKAIVCASSRGLGKACASSLVQEGVDVIINSRNLEDLKKTQEELSKINMGKVESVNSICFRLILTRKKEEKV